MDAQLLDLSRLQFAITVAFHMTFPSITVGLSIFLACMYGAYLRTSKEIYLTIYRFWRNIFAVGFGLGVVAGIVLTFEFGLNWAGYANATGPILGVTISMEVITAFFLEAGFIGIMLYGEGRVSKHVMFIANCMVALGTLLSTFWILASNSWMPGLFLLLLAPAYFQPLRAFAAAYHDRADALAASEHLSRLLSAPAQPPRRQELENVQRIELRNVTVHYPGRTRPALSDISLRIDAGQKVAITGPSGAGKSSLLKVIAGFTAVTQGEVLFDQCAASGALGVRVSWLGQRPYLFPGTLAENIALGRPEASRQEIEVAASQAHVMEFAAALPDGLNTQIGERGLGLSGGQAQRVALARAFLKNVPLLLLDEPTAHLDVETEAVLIATIVELARDKTVVLATHSPAPLALCDHVLELDDGTLRHSQVVQREEVFYA